MKKVKPVDGFLYTLFAARDSIIGGPDNVRGRDDVFRDELSPELVVDTCAAYDTGEWETGIGRNGNFTIAEQYESRELAEIGHKKWIELLRKNPDAETPKLMLWEE